MARLATPARGLLGRLVIGVLAVLTGCALNNPAQEETDNAVGEPAFRIIGYVTDTGGMASDEQLRQLTHVNYAFALPQRDGSLREIANPWKLEGYDATRVNYNGQDTMRQKTALAMAQASGIMIWTVVDDTTDETSLLRSIHAALEEAGP